MASIRLQDVAHNYEGNSDYALNPLQQQWMDGGAYALLGPSGCGKTTLLNIVSGLIKPSQGKVFFGEQDVTNLGPEQRNIAQVFQFPVVYDTMTVHDNLAFPLRNRGIKPAEVNDRVAKALIMLGLEPLAQRKAQTLNADDKQKISLGRGLVRTDVNAILFDEPLTVIDPQLKWELRTELKKIHRENGQTMIYVTHDQTEALTFADKVIVMYEGSVVQIGTPQELFDRPAHLFVGQFIGSPGMNVIPCQLKAGDAYLNSHPMGLTEKVNAPDGAAQLGIRPEFLSLGSVGIDTGIEIEIAAIENIGKHRLVKVHWEGQDITVIVGNDEKIPDNAVLMFQTDRINLYRESRLLS